MHCHPKAALSASAGVALALNGGPQLVRARRQLVRARRPRVLFRCRLLLLLAASSRGLCNLQAALAALLLELLAMGGGWGGEQWMEE